MKTHENLKAIWFDPQTLPKWAQLLDLAAQLCSVREEMRGWFARFIRMSGVDDARFVSAHANALRDLPGYVVGAGTSNRACRGGIWAWTCLACLLITFSSLAQETNHVTQEANLEQWLGEIEQALTNVDNYTTLFHRIEFVDGKTIPEEVVFLKFKRPFKVYMKWIKPSRGQESLYIQGANDNKIRAHGSGVIALVTVNLDPKGSKAMANSRHPIAEAGLHNLVRTIASNVRKALQSGDLVSKDHGEKTVYGRKTRELEGILSKDKAKGYYCYRCIVNVDIATRMPIRAQIFDWDNRLVEFYGFENLKLNPGLTNKDFDSKNPEYHFDKLSF